MFASLSLTGIAIIVGSVIAGVAAWSLWRVHTLHKRIDALVQNTEGETLEEAIAEYYDTVRRLQKKFCDVFSAFDTVQEQSQHGLHRVALRRYNPFAGEIGGDQSFSLILLDASHSGILLTSLHSRDSTRIYAKPIREGASSYQLSPEETSVLEEAMENS